MPLMQILADTYDNLAKNGEENLLKFAQSTQNAHLEIQLNKEGKFKGAHIVDKEVAETKIPVTEDSASRSSGNTPHPLFDKLKYMAGDYTKYCGEDNSEYHMAYMEGLRKWCESEYSVPQVQILYQYLQKGSLIADIVNDKKFSLDNSGRLTKKWEKAKDKKLSAGDQKEAFLRFRIPGRQSDFWNDDHVQEKFIQYYLSSKGKEGFCNVSGEVTRISTKHPSKIRNSGDKAKLISSNDKTNFTYRGRVDKPELVYSIGYAASQKAHNALRFLVEHQGVQIGERCYVLWGVRQEKTPPLTEDTAGVAHSNCKEGDHGTRIAEAFRDAIQGYRKEIREDSKLALVGLDAATTGRLAIVFYREYNGKYDCNELIDCIETWHRTCAWQISYLNKEEKRIFYEGAPAPKEIAKVVYGTEQKGVLSCDNKILSNAVERLLPCISEGKKIPRDMVQAAVNKAKYPQNYSSAGVWQQVLSVACALYRKYLWDYKKEEWTMEIRETDDLDYNCGRLLAVADAIESWALRENKDSKEEKKNIRTTTAMRYYTRFCQKPCIVWGEINSKLIIYKNQLGGKAKDLYDLLGEISEKIDMAEFRKKRNLDGMFCIGFDTQRRKLIQDAITKKMEREMGNNDSITEQN